MIPDIKPRAIQSLLVTAPIAVVEMGRHVATAHGPHAGPSPGWLAAMAIASGFVVFYCGWPLLVKGVRSFRQRRLNMFSLIAPGILITYVFSLAAACFPAWFAHLSPHPHQAPVYFEAAAMMTALVLLGQWIEAKAEHRTGSALQELSRLHPERACVRVNGEEVWLPTRALKPGDLVVLRAGDRVPVDGRIVNGQLAVDESMLTGEPIPAEKAAGAVLTGGTMVREGAATMTVEKVGAETVLSRMEELVRQAQLTKAPIQRVADRVTGKLVPGVMAIAALTFGVWWFAGPEPAGWLALIHAVTVLMITCPCALGLATPMSIMVGMGRGALLGILFKDAARLEMLASIDTMVLDKTGTLTLGRPVLHACLPFVPGNESWLLKRAASIEHLSHHPVAGAIREGARAWGLALEPAEEFRSETGGGITGRVAGDRVMAGHRRWLEQQGIAITSEWDAMARQYEEAGGTLVWVAVNDAAAGLLVVSDSLKEGAAQAVAALRARGLHVVMLTGDQERTARHIARLIGLDDVVAGVKPEEKAAHVAKLRAQGKRVAMAGDGINDAPALASADVGLAMGTGSSLALHSGHVNVLHGDLNALVTAIDLSRRVMRNIRQNLVFAFAYNLLMIPVAAGALYPFTGWVLTPMLASAAMSCSSISVIANALRLRTMRFDATA